MVELIRSGSNVPGITPDAFRLPRGTALRWDRSAPALARLFPSYAVLDSDPARVDPGITNWLLPAPPRIWIKLTAGPIAVRIGNRRYDPLPPAVMYGATSRAMPVATQGGITVSIDVSPLGWARFVTVPADEVRDRAVPLAELFAPAVVDAIVAALRGSDHDLGVAAALDAALARALPPPNPAEAVVQRIMAALADPHLTDLDTIAARAGVGRTTLQRTCRRYFGFAPKLLVMRSRFLRHLTDMLVDDAPIDHSAIPAGYHNVPHFLRDANRFLGMTPRRFLAMDLAYLRAALRARRLVLATRRPG